ncbi:S8 family serine peptidase [Puniceicoccales bacterium CK1056]|uniref:S8 family serine peptidase n=1 Tax=Oceanipulchritudo coccoides TaxID=2706888 RepID=A0A6B2M0H0_9BACT|nr:S8 family serine peptidase [Oceanipulchritudo coccoides]NDV62408.1 S8 family serine peptidase [Oceanipulchritudo coccoides]
MKSPHPTAGDGAIATNSPSKASRPDLNDALFFSPEEATVFLEDESSRLSLPAPSEDSLPGEYTIRFADQEAMEAFLEQAGASGLSVLGTIPELLMVRVRGSGAELALLVPEGSELENNYRVRTPTIPDEQLWQAGILAAFNGNALSYLGAPSAIGRIDWGEGIVVAVLDTGWSGHPSVPDGSVRQLDMLGGNDDGTYSAHGTAVAGLIASNDFFAPGIAPGSEILAIRVLDTDGQGDAFTLAQGIIAAVNNGASVINMSLGGYSDSGVLRQAVNYASENGVVMVAAAGNDGMNRLTYPAAYASVIGVNAVDANGNRTPFSNYGEGLDIAAPGYHVHALWDEEGYVFFDGTSASAPLVSGMAARLLQTGAATTPAAVQSLIRNYANDTGLPGEDLQYGAGILSAARLETSGQRGINDLALADLYPAVEESDGATIPLYVTFQNRGSEFTPGTSVDISVNGNPFFYRLPGMAPGRVESVTVPIPLTRLNAGERFEVTAIARMVDGFADDQPENNGGRIVLQRPPGE